MYLIRHLLLLLATSGLLFLNACSENKKEENKKDETEAKFAKFTIPEFKHLVVNCDRGRLKLIIHQYEFPRIEIHKSYQKYVNFEPKGDTLYIHTLNTPPNTKEQVTSKVINLYIPQMEYIEANISQITFMNFDSPIIRSVNKNNALRFYNCRVENLNIDAWDQSNILLDANNYFENIKLKIADDSFYSSSAMVLGNLEINATNLKNINFKNLPPNGFKWNKEKPIFLK